MIPILEITTSDAVRASLGVDEEEITDAEFAARGVADELLVDLLEWLPAGTDLDAIVRDGVDADRGTPEHVKFIHLSAYSRAFCAKLFVSSSANWRLTRLFDGSVDERRDQELDIEGLREELEGIMGRHKEALIELLAPGTAVASGFSVMGVSTPDFDPVTG